MRKKQWLITGVTVTALFICSLGSTNWVINKARARTNPAMPSPETLCPIRTAGYPRLKAEAVRTLKKQLARLWAEKHRRGKDDRGIAPLKMRDSQDIYAALEQSHENGLAFPELPEFHARLRKGAQADVYVKKPKRDVFISKLAQLELKATFLSEDKEYVIYRVDELQLDKTLLAPQSTMPPERRKLINEILNDIVKVEPPAHPRFVPLSILPNNVSAVRPPVVEALPPVPVRRADNNPYDSQGDRAHDAAKARTSPFDLQATGIKVGVLAQDIMGLDQTGLMVTPTITPGPNCQSCSSADPVKSEGTAMLEIVNKIAPGAELAFETATDRPKDMADHIWDLADTHKCNVIVDDFSYLEEPVFQEGVIAHAVHEVCEKKGVLYFSAAGNGGVSSSWEGPFNPDQSSQPNIPQFHVWYGADVGNLMMDGPDYQYVSLQWNDRFGYANSDFDLIAVDEDGNITAGETNYQSSRASVTHDPCEILPLDSKSKYLVVVRDYENSNGKQYILHLDAQLKSLNYSSCQETYGHCTVDHINAFGVAAAAATQSARAFDRPPSAVVDGYSSKGPRKIYFTYDGQPLNPPLVLYKPDLTAADHVDTSAVQDFKGTSAAAPHAAAIAALVLSLKASAGATPAPTVVSTALRGTAVPIGSEHCHIWDNQAGYGATMPCEAACEIQSNPMCQTFIDPTCGD